MSNKKFSKLAVLSLLGVLALTGCDSSSDEIYAKPSNYEDSIVEVDGKGKDDIHNDILEIIYDSMHDGSTPSKVLEKVLYRYAESIFGVYNNVTLKGRDEVTLKEAATANDETKTNAFIKKHKAFWLYDEDGKHVNDAGEEVTGEDWVPCETERLNVQARWATIETRIKEAMYSKATGGSYTKKHFFSELDFVEALYKDNKKVNYAAAKAADLKPVLVDYQFDKEDTFDATKGFLHRDYYQNGDYTYIEDEIIPSIYNDLLVEQYLLDEELAAVRNNRARKINVIKIEKYSSFTNNADALVKDLVEAIYSDAPVANEHVRTSTAAIEDHYDVLFDTYAKVSKGLYDEIVADVDASAIVTRLQTIASDIYEVKEYDPDGVADSGDEIKYYNNTQYGDLVKDFEKFKSANTYEELDMSLYNKFTSTGTTTAEEGLNQLTIDIDQTKTIYKDWYIQTSQPSLDANGKINERLFTVSVANSKKEVGGEAVTSGTDPEIIAKNLEDLEEVDRFLKNETGTTTWTWTLRDTPSAKENKFLCSINGAYFLKFEGKYSQANPLYDIVYDDGSAYYIVNVLEAAIDNKLKAKGDYSYSKTRGTKFLNTVIDEISKKVAETGSYASLSKEYWLKKMDITYHDQKVYDYFKDNYPDLFD